MQEKHRAQGTEEEAQGSGLRAQGKKRRAQSAGHRGRSAGLRAQGIQPPVAPEVIKIEPLHGFFL
jgi:hypothetical protein